MIRRIIIFTIITISLLVCVTLTAINFIDYNSVSNSFVNELKISPQNLKNIKITKFPLPYLTIDHIKEDGRLELENIEIHFAPWSLLILRPKISAVTIYNATIYSDEQDLDIINHDRIVSSFITNGIIDINFDVKNLTILNKNNQPIVTLNNCSLFKNNPISNSASFKGDGGYMGKLSGLFERKGNQINFDLTIANSDYNFHLLETYMDSKLINGKAEYLIQHLADILHILIPDLDSLFRKFNPNEKINIKFDILPTPQLLKLENVTIESNSLAGNGSIYLNKSDDVTSIIKLYFSKINAKSLITSSNNIKQFSNSVFGLRFLFENKSVITDILVDQIILNNDEVLNNTKILLNLDKGVLVVNDFSGMIKSGGSFQFIGNVTQNSVRSVFDGTIYLQHNDLNSVLNTLGYEQAVSTKPTAFILSSDLKLTLIDVYLQNLMLKTESTKVTGNITSRFIGSIPHFITILDFSSIDLNREDYPIISPMVKFVKSLSENMKDESYLAKYIPIRTVNYLGNFDIVINDILMGDNSFGKAYILANVSPGNIEISNLDIRTNSDYLNLSANLLASNIKPQLKVTINDGSLNVSYLTPESLLNLRNKLLNEFELEKIELKLDCMLSKITQDDLVLQNVKFALANNNALFKISNLEANLLSGKLTAEGNILLDPYTLNFVYALNSIDLAQLSNILPKGLLNNYGGMSINGTIATNGDNLKKLLYELNTQSEFVVKNAKISNLSIDSFIEKVNNKDYDLKYLKEDLAHAMYQGQTELDSLRGNVQLKNGIVTIKDVVFNTKYSGGSASLAVNLYNWDMVLSSILSFYIADSKPNLSDSNNKNTPINLKIQTSGTMFEPIKTLDETELTKALENKRKSTITKQ
ncbi:AsmA-like C-terminal region-containing protein [Candidatus Tisiphia endosymbiont of Hybos culiciformis]|uniref:AsmA-like C-terminal region-containing protein n=1 Tax=Candidatus Tisiphia endosymbiont of Hybos culiciformis TaxID=3139331 RepID=UPI003CCB6997